MFILDFFVGIVLFYICLRLTGIIIEWVKVGLEKLRPRKNREWDKYI